MFFRLVGLFGIFMMMFGSLIGIRRTDYTKPTENRKEKVEKIIRFGFFVASFGYLAFFVTKL